MTTISNFMSTPRGLEVSVAVSLCVWNLLMSISLGLVEPREFGAIFTLARLSGAADLRTLRKLPVRPREMASVAVGISLEIVLVLGLRFPEIAGRRHFGHDLARPQTRGIHIGDGIFRDAL